LELNFFILFATSIQLQELNFEHNSASHSWLYGSLTKDSAPLHLWDSVFH